MASARICSIWRAVVGRVCARATAVQHFFHGRAARGGETLHRRCSRHGQHGATPKGGRGKKKGRARTGRVDGQRKEEEAQTLWGMLYADDTGIVSRSPEGLKKMMTIIVTACAAFGLTVS